MSYTYITIAALAVLVAGLLYQRIAEHRQFRGLPRVGIDPGVFGLNLQRAKDEFMVRGRELAEQGYKEHKDTPYVVQTISTLRLIVPDKFIPELKNLAPSYLSFKQELLDRFLGSYTRMDAVLHTDIHREVVRGPLTRDLGGLVPKMKEEAEHALNSLLSNVKADGFTRVPAASLLMTPLTAVTSGILLSSSELSRNPSWLATVTGYTISVAMFCMAMRRLPAFMRPIASRTFECGRKLRSDIAQVQQYLQPVMTERLKVQEKKHAEKSQDIVQYLLDHAKTDEDINQVPLLVLFIIVAAIHTSFTTAVNVLYDLLALSADLEDHSTSPLVILRAEAQQELQSRGWSLDMLSNLHRMDSFLKESTRVNSAAVLSFQRLTLQSITLSNGYTIPANTHISAAGDARSRDPALYSNPLSFDPWRFYRQGEGTNSVEENSNSEDKEKSHSHLFTSIQDDRSWFGTGKQACPGRFYAAAQIKIVLCLLLLQYDMKLPVGDDGKVHRPKNWCKDEKMGPDTSVELLLRRREGSRAE